MNHSIVVEPGHIIRMIRGAGLAGAACVAFLAGASPIAAQTAPQDKEETAKPADTKSPYGVSYQTGSFTYSVPLFSIGTGEWPNRITLSLNYDSSGSRSPNRAWTFSSNARASGTFVRYVTGFEDEPLPEHFRYGAHFVLGNSSQSFELGDNTLSPSQFKPASNDGSSIDFVAGTPGYHGGIYFDSHGEFTVTSRTGSELKVSGGLNGNDDELVFSNAPQITLPDGNSATYTQQWFLGVKTTFEQTGNGLLVFMEAPQTISSTVSETKVCAYNLAYSDGGQITDCSGSSSVATIRYEQSTGKVTSITRPDGGVYQFEYTQYVAINGPDQAGGQLAPTKTRYHLTCVKEPGQSACMVTNTFDACDGPDVQGDNFQDTEWTGSRDRVTQQNLADGRVITYSYPGQSSPCRGIGSVVMVESGASTTINLTAQAGIKEKSRVVASLSDPLSRTMSYQWTGANAAASYLGRNHLVSEVVLPEGNEQTYTYDSRGNRTETRLIGKPGSGVTDIVATFIFPASCANTKTCNQPTSVTDANGNTTTFTYSSDHGGVLTSVGPAVNGVSPAMKYAYVQRTPWLKNGSGYTAGDPIWLLSEERSCKSSALNLTNGTCAGGASDLIVTTYDYGPNSGPNNLWLRSVAVTADGQTLRTCYSYDQLGRKISETQPNANLASCS